MAFKDRLRKAEKRLDAVGEPPCPECGGRIITEEHHADGTITYPSGPPCEVCADRPFSPGGPVRVLQVNMGGLSGAKADGPCWP